VLQVPTADVTQLHSLEIIPDPLIGIKIGSIARKLFQMQTFGRSSRQKGFHFPAAMNRRAIPDRDHPDSCVKER
jgi:hypothetical protein